MTVDVFHVREFLPQLSERKTDWEIISLDRLDFSGNLNRLADVMQQFTPAERKRVQIVYHDLRAELNPQITSLLGDVLL